MRCIVRVGAPSVHALGLAAVAAALLCAAALLPLEAPPFALFACPFRGATGLPCLSCGCTHAFAAIAHLHPLAALEANPLGAALALGCAAHVLWTCLRLCGLPYAPAAPRLTRRLRFSAAALLAANWAFVALRGGP